MLSARKKREITKQQEIYIDNVCMYTITRVYRLKVNVQENTETQGKGKDEKTRGKKTILETSVHYHIKNV